MQKKLLLIDANSLIHRTYHALPPLTTSDGKNVGAIHGSVSVLLKILKDRKPTHAVACFDVSKKTFRHAIDKNYKANREKADDELYEQIESGKEILKSLGIKVLGKENYEADDLIGTFSKDADFDEILILTGDNDSLALVNEKIKAFGFGRGISQSIIYDVEKVSEKYNGIPPEKLYELKALKGDPSDNIPGVRGVGEKTAIDLIKKFGSIENLYKKLETIKDPSDISKEDEKRLDIKSSVIKKLINGKEDALRSRKLVVIERNVPLTDNEKEIPELVIDTDAVQETFQKYELRTLLQRLKEELSSDATDKHQSHSTTETKARQEDLFDQPIGDSQKPITKKSQEFQLKLKDYPQYEMVTEKNFPKLISEIKKKKECIFDTETDTLNTRIGKLNGIAFAISQEKAFYLPTSHEKKYCNHEKEFSSQKDDSTLCYQINKPFYLELKEVFEDASIKKIGQNLKFDIPVLKSAGIEVRGIYFDTMIAAYVLDPGTKIGLDRLSFVHLGHQMIPIESLIGKKGKNQRKMSSVDHETVTVYAAEDAQYTYKLYEKFQKELSKKGNEKISKLFYDIEMPMIKILLAMEDQGIKIDKNHFINYAKKLRSKLSELEKKIFAFTPVKFNINSSQQLSEMLFDKMKLSHKGLKRTTKTKAYISTDIQELQKIKEDHPVIPLVIQHRELHKILTTYAEKFPKLADSKNWRIHTTYNQTITSTGRLASMHPNLQNIPVRTSHGEEIRKGFIAEKNFKLASIDYSQIELRIVASLADDKNMIEAFHEGKDIHTATASKVWNVDEENVSKLQRRRAKIINFGVIYGLGPYGLSDQLQIPHTLGKEFIEQYFKTYPKIRKYIDFTKDFARKHGYVETLLGRRRYLRNINHSNGNIRASEERQAINLPIQGLNADIMKIAMINIDKYIRKNNAKDDIRLLLQVHDELIFEIRESLVEKIIPKLVDIMENAYRIKVSLKCDVKIGDNWKEMEEMR